MGDFKTNGFATKKEITKNYGYQDDSFYLGKIHPEHGLKLKAGISDDRGIFIVSGSRSGKGTTLLISNLLTWGGGVFCIDPKGENASITAMRRGTRDKATNSGTQVRPPHFMGQNVAILDPYNTVQGASKTYRINYNPLDDIDITADDATEKIYSIVESMVIGDGGNSSHWNDTAESILAGLIEYVLVRETDASKRTIPHCVSLMQLPFEELESRLEEVKTPSGLAQDALSILKYAGEDELGSHRSTFSRQTRFMQDVRMKKQLQGGDGFSLVKAMQENWTIYVCTPPYAIHRVKRWLRMITRIAINAKMTSPFDHEGQQTLFLLDEFPQLGEMKMLEEASAYMAGYGIKLVPIIQNIGQIKNIYPRSWETFLSNAGAIIAWGLNDLDTEKYISDRMGSIWEWGEGYSHSQSGSIQDQDTQQSISRNTSERERAIRWPNEIHYQGARENMRGFVISGKGAPFTIQRLNYFEEFPENSYDSPEHIRRLENG